MFVMLLVMMMLVVVRLMRRMVACVMITGTLVVLQSMLRLMEYNAQSRVSAAFPCIPTSSKRRKKSISAIPIVAIFVQKSIPQNGSSDHVGGGG
jgi:hypothetical protein